MSSPSQHDLPVTVSNQDETTGYRSALASLPSLEPAGQAIGPLEYKSRINPPVHSTAGDGKQITHDKSGFRPLRFYVLFGYYGLTSQLNVEIR
jgi:hypothetical protein